MPTLTETAITAADRTRPLSRMVLALALPVLLQQLLVLTVSLSDRYLAGHLLQATGNQQASYQAAQTTANYLAWFVASYTVMVSAGASAVVARCVGAKDDRAANLAVHQALVLAFIVGLLGSMVGLSLANKVVGALQLEGEAAAHAVSYLRPMFWLLPFQVVEAAGVACLQGAGDTRTGLFVQGGIAMLNLPIAWTLCRGFGTWEGFGFQGIALGTSISFLLGAIAVTTVLTIGRAGLKIHLAGFWPDWHMIWRLLRVSVPAGIDSLSVVAGQFVFLMIINRLGDIPAAAHGTALGWEAMGFQSAYAFGIAAMALVGQNLGAKRPEEAARAGWTAFGLGCLVTSLTGVVFFTFAPQMARVFNPKPEQQAIVDAAVPALRLVALAMPALASTIIFTQALRGAGDTRIPVLFTWIGFLAVRLPLAYWLTGPSVGLGLYGAWLAMCADLLVRGVFFFVRFASGKWKGARV